MIKESISKMKKRIVCSIAAVLILAISLPLMTACSGSGMPEGLYPMYEKTASGAEWGYIDKSGEYVIDPQFSDAMEFSEGLAAVLDPESELWGYIDESGSYVIEPQFAWVKNFSEGLAFACYGPWNEDNGGYIDTSGEWHTETEFTWGQPFKDGYAIVEKSTDDGRKYGVIKRNGEIAVPLEYDNIMGTIYGEPVTVNGNFIAKKDTIDESLGVYIDKDGSENGTVNWEEAYIAAWDFTQGPCLIYDENKGNYYYVDKQGEIVIKDVKGHGDYYSNFSENRAAVIEKYPAGEDASEDENGYSGDLYGFMDENGEMVTEVKFFRPDTTAYYSLFHDGIKLVRTLPDENGKISYGYIDKNGKWLVKKEYDMELDYDVRWQD